MNNQNEIRTMKARLEMRTDTSGNPVLFGQAAVYNSLSKDLGGFKEIIEPGFFTGVLDGDIIATLEHDAANLLGRTSAKTLRIWDSPEALRTENHIPPTTTGNNLMILIKRGDIRGMSFAFSVKPGGDRWDRDKVTGAKTRRLLRNGCAGLYDVTYTANPAYVNTEIAQRSMKEHFNDDPTRKQRPRATLLKLSKLTTFRGPEDIKTWGNRLKKIGKR
jgi:HK97 family phage prohead protease